MDKKIICRSSGRNASNFMVKLPKTITIQPNAEIALISGAFSSSSQVIIDDTNDTLAFQFGNFDSQDIDTTAGNKGFINLPPFIVKIPHGTYKTRNNEDSQDDDDNSIVNALEMAVLNQSPYKMWQVIFNYTDNTNIEGYVYLRNAIMDAFPSLEQFVPQNQNITITQNGNIAEISDVNGGHCLISKNHLVYPYACNIANLAAADQSIFKITVPQHAYTRFFCGLALDRQCKLQEYDNEKSWVGLFNGNQEGASNTAVNYVNQLPISIEVGGNGNFFVKIANIDPLSGLPDGTYAINSDSTINANTQDTDIRFNTFFDDDGANLQRVRLQVQFLNPLNGANLRVAMLFEFPPQWAGLLMNFALCYDSGAAQTLNLNILTEDELEFTVLKTLDETSAGGNYNLTMVTNRLQNNAYIDGDPRYRVGQKIVEMSKQCNFKILTPAFGNYDIILGSRNAGAPEPLTLNHDTSASDNIVHIQILNLPIKSFVCSNTKSDIQNIIHSRLLDSGNLLDYFEPPNIIYCKLQNKQPITINNLELRIVDNNGKIQDGTINTSYFVFHLREGSMPSNMMLNKMTELNKSLMDNFKLVFNKLS